MYIIVARCKSLTERMTLVAVPKEMVIVIEYADFVFPFVDS